MCQEKDCYLCETGYWINKSKCCFTRNRFIPYRLVSSVVKERNNVGVFMTTYRYNTLKIDEAFLFGDMYFDFDCKDDFQKVREDALRVITYLRIVFKIPSIDLRIFFSGNKGVHITIPSVVMGIEPHLHLNGIFKCIAESASSFTRNKTLDLVIYDNKRLFRIPCTIHESTNLYKIPITEDELRDMPHTDILKLAENKRSISLNTPKFIKLANEEFNKHIITYNESVNKKPIYNTTGNLKTTPPCIQFIIEHGSLSGSRNNSTAALASFYKAKGFDIDKTITIIEDWNSKLNLPPLQSNELIKTIKSIYSGKINYGCSSLKLLSECNESKCALKKGKGKL